MPLAVIFDDAYEHEAWNDTPDTRVVLFVDFRKPLHFPTNSINWLLLHLAVFTPFIREGIEKEKAGNESSTQKRSHCGIDKTSQPLLDLAFNRG